MLLEQLEYFEYQITRTPEQNRPRIKFLQECIDNTNKRIKEINASTNDPS